MFSFWEIVWRLQGTWRLLRALGTFWRLLEGILEARGLH